MWPRVVEAMLACWLAVSPFVFRHPGDRPALWWTDGLSAAMIAGFALASYAPKLRRAHLLELPVAAGLIAYGWATSTGLAEPAKQNWMIVGLLLLMLAVIPSECDRPPRAWRDWNARQQPGG